MNKIYFSVIAFLIGLASGYFFIIFAGYTSYWTGGLIVTIAKVLKEYEMLYMMYIISSIKDILLLLSTAIPIFLTSGLLLIYFIKIDIKLTKWLSSIGLLIIPAWASGIPTIYGGMLFDAFILLAILLLVNLFFINKISNIINAPNKNEERNNLP